jgi:enoyl-CoA hydratase
MAYENLLIERDGGVLVVTINRPEKLNALNTRTVTELGQVMDEAASDSTVHAIVLTGSGEKSFVAGADINELAVQTPVSGREHARSGQRVFDRIERLGKPVIAAVNGFALGGGCELAMACTLRIASDTAKFGQPEINLGLIPGYAGSQRLPRPGRTRPRARDAADGRANHRPRKRTELGSSTGWCPAASLMTEARALAHALAAKAPVAVRYILEAVAGGLEMSFTDAQDYEATLFGLVSTTDDMREGTRAFLEKRKAAFQGR